MEVFASIFKQRRGLKRSNESKAGSASFAARKVVEPNGARSLPTSPGANKQFNRNELSRTDLKRAEMNRTESNRTDANRTNSYFAQLRPKVENEFNEFSDRYEIRLNCSSIDLQKSDFTIKYNEIDNQIRIIGLQSKKFGDRVVLTRKILRCFRLPNDIISDHITSVFLQSGQLKIRIPKCQRTVLDGSDGESPDECTECEESSDLFN